MPDRTPPVDGATITVPAGHVVLDDVVDDANEATETLADLVGVLRTDPVDLIALRRHATRLFALAEQLDSDADDVMSGVAR
jgi:hypothetical protein